MHKPVNTAIERQHREPAFAGGQGDCSEFTLRRYQQILAQKTWWRHCPTVVINLDVEKPTGTTENAEIAKVVDQGGVICDWLG